MDRIIKDFKFGFRSLIGKPTYSIIALLTLTLGIGVTTTMFSLVNSILLKPLPLPESHQLVELNFETRSVQESSINFSTYELIKEASTPFQNVTFGAYDQGVVRLGEQFKPLSLKISSADYFELFKTPAFLGRWYNKEDLGKNAVVLSYNIWAIHFNRNDNIVGQAIEMNKEQFTVIGVMPAGFVDGGAYSAQLWTPISSLGRPGFVYGRLKNDISIEQALRQSDSINRILNEQSDQNSGEWKVGYRSLKEKSVRNVKSALILLSLAVSAVFLIALLNVLNLSFAHYGNRTHELSVRVSMGATRKRLVYQLLAESFLLSAAGGAIGLLVAAWGLELVRVFGESSMPRIHEIGLDFTTITITLSLVLVAALLTAMLPAYTLINPRRLSMALQEAGRKSTGSRNSQRIRKVLVAAEVSTAVVLLIGAGLLLRSYAKLIEAEPGFNPVQIVTGHIWLPDSMETSDQKLQHWQTLLERVAKHPDVSNVAGTSALPMSKTGINYDVMYTYDGSPVLADGSVTRGATRAVSNSYFDVLEIPLLEGRTFGYQDQQNSSPVVIINRALADTLWEGESPIGRKLILPDWMGGGRTIVGVIGNVKHLGLRSEFKAEFYTPLSQQIYPGMSIVAKTSEGKGQDVLRLMAKIATEMEVAAPLINAAKLNELTSSSVEEEKLILQLVSIFSIIAVVLASIGVYGISDNLVSQRTNEIGVRMALGARPNVILKWVLLSSLKPVFYGAVAGILLALVMVQVLTNLLYEVSSLDPITYLIVPIILVLVGVTATWLPARRATRIHPQQALHYE